MPIFRRLEWRAVSVLLGYMDPAEFFTSDLVVLSAPNTHMAKRYGCQLVFEALFLKCAKLAGCSLVAMPRGVKESDKLRVSKRPRQTSRWNFHDVRLPPMLQSRGACRLSQPR